MQFYFYCNEDFRVETRSKHVQEIILKCISQPCDCIPKLFVIETLMNFESWFIYCIKIFFETIMFDELRRWKTFEGFWYHKFIEPEALAKTGFYYIGPRDRVKCAFCRVIVDQWEPSDSIDAHYYLSKNCPLLLGKETKKIEFEGNSNNLKNILKKYQDDDWSGRFQ